MEIVENFEQNEERRYFLPETYTWQEFERLASALSLFPNARVAYLDGRVDLAIVDAARDRIKNRLESLLQVYFDARKITCDLLLGAERTSENKEVSFQPDLLYQIEDRAQKTYLAIEIIFAGSNFNTLEKCARFEIEEVWLWNEDISKSQENARAEVAIYQFVGGKYERRDRSEFCSDLDPVALARWVEIPSCDEARNALARAIAHLQNWRL